MCDDGNEDDREHDRTDGEAGHGAPVLTQVPLRSIERRIEQHRRHEERERELGIEHQSRHARKQRQCRPCNRHECRIWQRNAARDRGEDRPAEEQRDHDLEHGHQRTL